ncbi:MAG: cobalamin-dependent protein [Desulfosarcina sp.]|nr:cobalamin-dependent protein [Desulfobacterales bacterium]
MGDRKIRVLMAKVGLDGHDKGVIQVTNALKDAGMEVIYTGLRRKVMQVINMAIQEDVDVIGISLLSGSHLSVAEKMVDKMKAKEIANKVLIMGGVIPDEDVQPLKDLGVSAVFTQSSTYEEMIDFIKQAVPSE